MRSSKSRSRGNKNRNNRPTGGNVINRVFDSSGPDGKVRGTPQQIIEKYLQLHRDAQLAGDRVNAENFAQHAEHYTRLLAEAQREVDRQREEQEQFNRERQAERDRERAQRHRGNDYAADPAQMDQPEIDLPMGDDLLVDVVEVAAQGDLPEGKPAFLGKNQDRRAPRERQERQQERRNNDRGPRPERQERPDRQAERQERQNDWQAERQERQERQTERHVESEQPAERPAPRRERPAPVVEAEVKDAPAATGFAESEQPSFLSPKPRKPAKPQAVAEDAGEVAPKPRAPRKPRVAKVASEAAE